MLLMLLDFDRAGNPIYTNGKGRYFDSDKKTELTKEQVEARIAVKGE